MFSIVHLNFPLYPTPDKSAMSPTPDFEVLPPHFFPSHSKYPTFDYCFSATFFLSLCLTDQKSR